MTAMLGVVALTEAATVAVANFSAGVRALGGFAPFGADEFESNGIRLWVARSRHGSGIAVAEGCVVVFDGRLRDGAAFRKHHRIAAHHLDADAVLRAYASVGLALFEDLDAEAAVLLIDRNRQRVVLYRDPLGERGLRFRRDGDRLSVATRGSALIAMVGVPFQPNPVALAHYFALRAPPDDVAWLEGVSELPAGELRVYEQGRERITRIEPKLPRASLRFRSDEAAAEAWRTAVGEAVERAVADAPSAALMLSGGIDSTMLASTLDPKRGFAVSWSVPEVPECDEVALAAATAKQLGLRHMAADCADATPLSDLATWPMEDEAPLANPYRRLNQAVFSTARSAGASVLLSGNFGDHLLADRRDWAASFLRERGLRALLVEFVVGLQPIGSMVRDLLAWGIGTWRRPRSNPGWLTTNAAAMLPSDPVLDGSARRIAQILGRATAEDAELARRFANALGLEMRFPYRDPGLLQFALALPAHYWNSPRGPKWLSRRALFGRVPEHVRLRPKSGSLTPLFCLGVLDRYRPWVERILWDDDALWPRFLDRGALRAALERPQTETELLLIWLALALELWIRAHRGLGPAVLASRVLIP